MSPSSEEQTDTHAVRPTGEEELEAGVRKAERMMNPQKPSRGEVEEHNKHHLPYRSWCRHCVRGRGVEEAHRRQAEEPRMPEIHLDFMFIGEGGEDRKWTVLVAKERSSRMLMASVVPSKSTGTFAARRVVAFMREAGCEFTDITIKTDNEEAVKALVSEIGRVRAGGGSQARMSVETSPAYSSASNGVVERGIQSVQGQLRVLRSALEEKLEVKIDSGHSIWPWLMEHAAFLLNRGEVGHDGRTSFERCKGKHGRMPGMESGEKVLWRRKPVGGHLAKMTLLWEDGMFLGVKGSSGEYIIGDPKGIWKTRTVRRRPDEDKWHRDNLQLVGGPRGGSA